MGSRRPPEERFWEKVDVRGPDECWLWTAHTTKGGYGLFRPGGLEPKTTAHRWVYEHVHGELPKSITVDHRDHCNTRCVNVAHLRAATVSQNGENRKGAQSNSRSGVRGVSWCRNRRQWAGEVSCRGVKHRVGYFTDLGEAETAVIAKRNELFTHNEKDRHV